MVPVLRVGVGSVLCAVVWEAERECMQDRTGRSPVSNPPVMGNECMQYRTGRSTVSDPPVMETITAWASFAEQAKHRTTWSQQARRGG